MRIYLKNIFFRLFIALILMAVTPRFIFAQDDGPEEETVVEESNVPAEADSKEKLTIDNTLTIRILKTTASKKTIMINRGAADGLEMGAHARLFNEGGTVARAVLVDKKDDRSIWSVYRQVSPDLIESDQVMSLKITNEVKITNDETKSVLREGLDQGLIPDRLAPNNIPLDQVQGDLPSDLAASGVTEVNLAGASARDLDLSQKKLEIYLKGFFLAQQAEATSSRGGSFTGNSYAGSISLGLESYFTNPESMLKRISLAPFAHFGSQKLLSYEGAQTNTQFYEIGLGINYYFLDAPHTAEVLHPFFSLAGAMGVVNDEFSSGQRDTNLDAASVSKVTGKTASLSAGLGVKYFTTRGLSFSFLTDLVRRVDQFDADPDTGNALWDRVVTGPRISFGMGMRF
jgi:hypothetical protein